MPIYRIACDCGHEEDIFRPLARYDELPDHCGAKMHRAICLPMIASDVPAYKSMATGEMIEGRAQHRAHLKKHKLIEVGNEPVREQASRADHNVKPEFTEAIRQHLGR